jgi:hypothetical protein
MVSLGPVRWPGVLPTLEQGVPVSKHGPDGDVEHGHRQVTEVVLVIGFGFRDARAMAAQDVSGGGEEGVQAGQGFS